MARKNTQPAQTTQPSQPSSTPLQTAPAHEPTAEQIAVRAYELFLARGAQHGGHESDWHQAERELRLGRQ
jgi:hypothetical protein